MEKIRIAVVGTGQFGRNHCRVVGQSQNAELSAVVDIDPARAVEAAAQYHCEGLTDFRQIAGRRMPPSAVPTLAHMEVGCGLMEAGMDVLIEKLHRAGYGIRGPAAAGRRGHWCICRWATWSGSTPAVMALEKRLTLPLFFEIHRMSVFSPRSLDIDVVLDLMIHDIDIVLALVGAEPEEIRAAGISVLSGNVDIANVRLQFGSGCVANLTASRVSTEKVRKLRLFQPRQYLSLDYSRQDGLSHG
jgi:predicted dehydrogenase